MSEEKENYGKKRTKELMKNNIKLKKLKFITECEQNLEPTSLQVIKLASVLSERALEIKYKGDMSDFGNEVGFCLGKVIENMTDEQITDLIHGLRHGISLTNGTH